jgi:PhnB protein
MGKVKAIPEGYNTVSVYLVVPDSAKAIELYQKAFGAQEKYRMAGPGGQGVMHAEITIGDSTVMLSDENPGWGTKSPLTLGASPVGLFIYTEDVDAAFDRAVKAGCTVEMPLADMFWGDRYGKLKDPFGHQWQMATHKEDVSPEEMAKRAEAFFASMAEGKQ